MLRLLALDRVLSIQGDHTVNTQNLHAGRPAAVLALIMVMALTLLTTVHAAASAPATRSQAATDPTQTPPASSVSEGPDPSLPIFQPTTPAGSPDNAAQQNDPVATETPPSSSVNEPPDPSQPIYQPPAATRAPRTDTSVPDTTTANPSDAAGSGTGGGVVAGVNEAPDANQPAVTSGSGADTSVAGTSDNGGAPSNVAPVAAGHGTGVVVALPNTGAGAMANQSGLSDIIRMMIVAVAAVLITVAAGVSIRRAGFVRISRRD